MPRARGTKQYQPLTLGLITEASPLDFPQGATVDERNFLFEHNDNKRVKRKGLSTRKTLDYTVQHSITALGVRVGKPYYWDKYEITILPLIVEDTTFTRVEFHFYNALGVFLGSFFTATDISAPVKDVEFEDYDATILKVDNERLVLNVNFLSAMYYIDIDKSVGTDLVCTQSVLYYRDFATLSTDNPIDTRPLIDVGGNPIADVNYEYNVANAGFVKSYPSRNPRSDSPLSAILLAWSADNSIRYPAMSDNVNTYTQRDDTNGDLVFDVDLYKIGTPRGFVAPRGSQIINNDGVLGGRDVDDATVGPSKLPEILRLNI